MCLEVLSLAQTHLVKKQIKCVTNKKIKPTTQWSLLKTTPCSKISSTLHLWSIALQKANLVIQSKQKEPLIKK